MITQQERDVPQKDTGDGYDYLDFAILIGIDICLALALII